MSALTPNGQYGSFGVSLFLHGGISSGNVCHFRTGDGVRAGCGYVGFGWRLAECWPESTCF